MLFCVCFVHIMQIIHIIVDANLDSVFYSAYLHFFSFMDIFAVLLLAAFILSHSVLPKPLLLSVQVCSVFFLHFNDASCTVKAVKALGCVHINTSPSPALYRYPIYEFRQNEFACISMAAVHIHTSTGHL